MNFIQKLIDDTDKGDWDFSWKYSDGSKSYTFQVPKHYLSGMNFSIDNDPNIMIFPNGYSIKYDKSLLAKLKDSIDKSLERTVDECVKLYLMGKEMTPEQEAIAAEQEKAKQDKVKQDGQKQKSVITDATKANTKNSENNL
jgi:hypothetical protein